MCKYAIGDLIKETHISPEYSRKGIIISSPIRSANHDGTFIFKALMVNSIYNKKEKIILYYDDMEDLTLLV